MSNKAKNTKHSHKLSDYVGWLGWVLGLIFIGPLVWVILYKFVNPPVTLNMAMHSDKKIERIWMPLDQISPNFVDAAIAAEDANFCWHHGFDSAAIKEAWRSNQKSKKLRGASTISMQTAKNAFLWPQRTWVRKGMEAYFTFLMEQVWSKQRIMEMYLNIVEWGDGIYGAEAASQHYFHKHASDITAGEAASLIAVLPNPLHWSPLAETGQIPYRADAIEERAAIIRVDGKSRCVLPQPSYNARPKK